MKIRNTLYILGGMLLSMFASCADEETFSSSKSNLLSFSTDTVRLDTTFSNVPTVTRSLWVFNKSGKGLRNISVQLMNPVQTGFRVNVDGSYLGPSSNYQAHDIEVRNGDSIRVFIECTPRTTNQSDPQSVDDDLVFTLESGVREVIHLNTYSWDATLVDGLTVSRDTTISSTRPLVFRKGITVNEGATLTIAAGTTLYFHQDAGLDVYGRLVADGTVEKPVVLRGDRIDWMFDYLPYDLTPGQWQGVHFRSTSFGNILRNTDLHSAYNAIVCDNSSLDQRKLLIENTSVHNNQGHGLLAHNVWVEAVNSIFSNSLGDCVNVVGGKLVLDFCTLAQFYPFSGNRRSAIYLSNHDEDGNLPLDASISNSLITGYADDVVSGYKDDYPNMKYHFDYCVIRTPEPKDDEILNYQNVVFEEVKDTTIYGEKNFKKLDTDNLWYDFRLDSVAAAIGKANPSSAVLYDRNGVHRDDKPDAGCYEFK